MKIEYGVKLSVILLGASPAKTFVSFTLQLYCDCGPRSGQWFKYWLVSSQLSGSS